MTKRIAFYVSVLVLGMVGATVWHPLSAVGVGAQAGCQTFSETGKAVCGRFWQYWQSNGGLAQQGYPLTGTFDEVSDTDGKPYIVQYFERAVFEYHPENQPPFDVLLSLLGSLRYKQLYPTSPGQGGNTHYTMNGKFLDYWKAHGGLAQQGYPISNEFTEVSSVDGKPYTVQYFERAVFELHPENTAPNDVLLSLLGTFQLKAKYTNGEPPTSQSLPRQSMSLSYP